MTPVSIETHDRVPPKALILSAAALAIPVASTFLLPDAWGRHEPLLWLLAIVPAFLLAFHRGWRGAAVALATGMALLSVSHAAVVGLGRDGVNWPLLFAVLPVYIGITLGIGWISELLHRERALAMQNAIDLTLIIDAAGRIRYASPSAVRILGTPPSELTGRTLAELGPPEQAAGRAVPVPAAGDAGGVVETWLRLRHADGGWRDLEATVQDLSEDPAVRGVVVRARDATERVRADEQLRRAQRMQAVARLAGGLSHDLNNSLTVIQGRSQLLLEDLPEADAHRADIEEIRKAARRATTMIHQLTAYARQQVLRPERVDLSRLVEDMRPILNDALGADIEVVTGLDQRLGPVWVDPNQLRQVLLTLAARARDAMPDGGRLTLRTLRSRIQEDFAAKHPYPVATGNYAVLSISDTGSGMDEDAQARVFEPFNNTLSHGTGLELSSVYGIIKQSGGYIWIDSEPDRGSTFSVYLPEAESEASVDAQSPAPADAQRWDTVLVVEDDAQVRSLVCRILLKRGFCVLEASDGEDALVVARGFGRPIHLLVTDLQMPRIGGHDLARQLVEERPDLRTLFISGYADEATRTPDPLADRSTFLHKPFAPEEFVRKVDETLGAGAAA